MTVWATSDLHFLDRKVSALRGYSSPAVHDERLILRWNHQVRDDDIVWLLGDMGQPRAVDGGDDATLALVSQLKGRKQLILGNHDSPHPMHRNARRNQGKWMQVFESVQAFAKTSICGTDFLLSHFPYEGDHTREDRYTQYRLRDQGMPLLHGHIHSEQALASLDRKIVHVGMDAWNLRPVKDTQIKELLGL